MENKLTYDELERENLELHKELDHIKTAYDGNKKALSYWMNAYHINKVKESKNIMNRKIEVFQDEANEWRWRVRSGSNVIADSGEGYKNRQDCVDMVQSIFTTLEVTEGE